MGDMLKVDSIKHHVCYNPEITIVVSPKEHSDIHKKDALYDKASVIDAAIRWFNLSEAIKKSYINDGTDDISAAKRDLMFKAINRIKEFEIPRLLPYYPEITKTCLIDGCIKFERESAC